ncbi:DUF3307 domain-containing protein [Thalassotalea marina]|uniref:Membrane protein n=1 Tax=Thalassotalea marina TaxID=1673741 RepID=A0A919BP10_9GAMM|nr:DUF3307 domain-containing protein [Thalassotalea marina]GHG01412.1 membrane protein [Thalassotalea marina]
MIELLLLLITAHVIADFYLQPASWVSCRNSKHLKSPALKKHLLVHATLYSLVFITCQTSIFAAIIAVIVLTLTHGIIDLWKSYRPNNLTYFVIDQLLHLLIILSVWIAIAQISWQSIQDALILIAQPQNVIIALAYVLVCKPASVIIALALQKYTRALSQENSNSAHATDNMGLVSAGAMIGYIERCLAITFIFVGQFAGIGFLVATKTIFRFGDLTKNKDMKLTEYMMLGTLLSYAIALVIGWNAIDLYQQLS